MCLADDRPRLLSALWEILAQRAGVPVEQLDELREANRSQAVTEAIRGLLSKKAERRVRESNPAAKPILRQAIRLLRHQDAERSPPIPLADAVFKFADFLTSS